MQPIPPQPAPPRAWADRTARRHARRGVGLTLLEMVIVVFILGLVAASAVSLTGGIDQQFRYEQTRSRLTQLRSAIIGAGGVGLGGDRPLSGYVVDVGLLPADIDALVNDPTAADETDAFERFEPIAPVYDPTPEADEQTGRMFNNDSGDEVELGAPGEKLGKGWRGPYLQTDPSGAGRRLFRDGWGNVDPVASQDLANHGWLVRADAEGDSLTLTSLGLNGADDSGADPASVAAYDADLSETIGPDDWLLSPAGWAVTVVNQSGSAVENLRAVLLVYRAGRWQHIASGKPAAPIAAGGSGRVFIDDEAGEVPVGEHLLVLVEDTDGAVGNGELPYEDATGRVSARVRLTARSALPRVELVVR